MTKKTTRKNCVFQNDLLLFRYLSPPKVFHYKYRFQCPDSPYYDAAHYDLQVESLESYAWNLVDNIVCSHGTGGHKLSDVCIYDRK